MDVRCSPRERGAGAAGPWRSRSSTRAAGGGSIDHTAAERIAAAEDLSPTVGRDGGDDPRENGSRFTAICVARCRVSWCNETLFREHPVGELTTIAEIAPQTMPIHEDRNS